MKFSNGYWLVKEGLQCYYPQQVFSIEEKVDGIEMIASTKKLTTRGDTLEGPVLTYTFSAPMKDVIKVKIVHYKGALSKQPQFILSEAGGSFQYTEDEEKATFKSGELMLVIDKKNEFRLSFERANKLLTSSFGKSAAYIKEKEDVFLEEKLDKAYMREQLSLDIDEQIYGFGERFTPFVKNGQSIDIWNEDGGTASEQGYKNVPFYISNKGYGILVGHTGKVSFEVASEKVSKVQFSVQGQELSYYVIAGDNMKQVLTNYTALAGRPPMLPTWSFGLWLSTSFTTDYNEETVMHFIDKMKERDIPLSVFHFDCFWMKAYHWSSFKWDDKVFKDPKGMLQRLHEKGLKVCVWINPYIAQASELFDEGMANGYFIKRTDGSVWQGDLWQPGMAIVDFTNPKAYRWYQDKLAELLDMGVDCFKTDFGERIPVTDVRYESGANAEGMHNYYTYLYNKAVFEIIKEKKGKNDAIVFARSATVGSQSFPVHWGGDCEGNFSSMAETLRGGLSLGLSGFGYWSHDIGGFESTSTADVYKRWVAFGLLSSHSRLHGNTSYRVPWLYDEEAVDVVRFFTKMKCELMPYLYNMAWEASELGLPMLRAMVLEFEEDPNCRYLDKEYMLGDSLLVAPVFNEEGSVNYYLPKGRWTHFITGEVYEGGVWKKETYHYLGLPLFVKPNSILMLGSRDDRPDYDYRESVRVALYELDEDVIVSSKVLDSEGKIVLTVAALKQDQTLTVQYKGGNRPWEIVLKNIFDIQGATGGVVQHQEDGVHIVMNEGVTDEGSVICYL